MKNERIIVLTAAEPMVFQTVGAAESYMEPIDVVAGEYEVYDNSGRRMTLEVQSTQCTTIFGSRSVHTVHIRPGDQESLDHSCERVTVAMRRFLEKYDAHSVPSDEDPISDDKDLICAIVDQYVRLFGYEGD